MFKNGIDLKSLGIWNLVITVIVLIVRLAGTTAAAYDGPLWAMPLLTLGLGLLLIYKANGQFDRGNAALRTRLILFTGAVMFVTLKYAAIDESKMLYAYIGVNILLLAGLSWYFVRWYVRKTVLI